MLRDGGDAAFILEGAKIEEGVTGGLNKNQVDTSLTNDNIDISKKAGTYLMADPMFEVAGPAVKSNPEDVAAIRAEISAANVERKYRAGSMSYMQGLAPGKPGQFVIDENASCSAWLHEYKHFCNDRADGFLGMRIFMDTEKCKKREIDAYNIEIELAKQTGRPDIAEKLEKLKQKELSRYD